jgi:mono/diheme cytochrome c family protein
MTPVPIHCGWALALLALSACTETPLPGEDPRANPRDPTRIALGSKVYLEHCAGCHGAKLEGQPNWRSRLPNGRMPAPPHDDTGHTWHHPDHVLFGITKAGLVPPYAPKDYQSDMPAFGGKLADDEIWTVLTYIKSHWTREVLPARAEILRNAAKR